MKKAIKWSLIRLFLKEQTCLDSFLFALVLLSGSGTQRAKKNSHLKTFFLKIKKNIPGKTIIQC